MTGSPRASPPREGPCPSCTLRAGLCPSDPPMHVHVPSHALCGGLCPFRPQPGEGLCPFMHPQSRAVSPQGAPQQVHVLSAPSEQGYVPSDFGQVHVPLYALRAELCPLIPPWKVFVPSCAHRTELCPLIPLPVCTCPLTLPQNKHVSPQTPMGKSICSHTPSEWVCVPSDPTPRQIRVPSHALRAGLDPLRVLPGLCSLTHSQSRALSPQPWGKSCPFHLSKNSVPSPSFHSLS